MFAKKLLVLITVLLCSSTSIDAGLWERIKNFRDHKHFQSPKIKVLVDQEIGGCMLEIKGRYNLFDPNTNERIATRFLPKSSFCQPIAEGIRWGEQFPGLYQLHIVPDHPETTICINGVEYQGSLYLYQVEGSLNIVNEVSVEDYVSSILVNQVADMPFEALAALAISVRTEACYQAQHAQNHYYHVIANDVGYEGHTAIHPGSLVSEVMKTTRNLVLSSTRAFEGAINPIMTECLYGLYGKGESRWDSQKVREMAENGNDAKTIVADLFPEASIELM